MFHEYRIRIGPALLPWRSQSIRSWKDAKRRADLTIMGPPRFSVPLRIYERGNVDSGYKADSYIGYFYRYSTGGRRTFSMARSWVRRLGRAWAESFLLNADERHDEICSAHDYANSRVLLTHSWLDTRRSILMLKRIQTAYFSIVEIGNA